MGLVSTELIKVEDRQRKPKDKIVTCFEFRPINQEQKNYICSVTTNKPFLVFY